MAERELPPLFIVSKKAAIIGYILGVLGGVFLVVPISFMGMLGHSWDPLLYYLHTCPGCCLLHLLPDSFRSLAIAMGLQIFLFWGILGALAPQGRA